MEQKNNTALFIIIAVLVIGFGFYFFSMRSTDKTLTTTTTTNNTTTMQDTNDKGVLVGGAYMVRTLDIIDNAVDASNVTTLVAAVKAAGLVDTLKGPGPFTVFAPTNDAFEKLPAGTVETVLKPENKAKLTSILTYHVVAGKFMAGDLKNGMMLKSVQGENLKVTMKDGNIMINNAKVITTDVISSNGVTFVIDTVLMPE